MTTLTTAEAAKMAGVTSRTLQLWTEEGLLRPQEAGRVPGKPGNAGLGWMPRDVGEARLIAYLRARGIQPEILRERLDELRKIQTEEEFTGGYLIVDHPRMGNGWQVCSRLDALALLQSGAAVNIMRIVPEPDLLKRMEALELSTREDTEALLAGEGKPPTLADLGRADARVHKALRGGMGPSVFGSRLAPMTQSLAGASEVLDALRAAAEAGWEPARGLVVKNDSFKTLTNLAEWIQEQAKRDGEKQPDDFAIPMLKL